MLTIFEVLKVSDKLIERRFKIKYFMPGCISDIQILVFVEDLNIFINSETKVYTISKNNSFEAVDSIDKLYGLIPA
jgi:hypothetical protein